MADNSLPISSDDNNHHQTNELSSAKQPKSSSASSLSSLPQKNNNNPLYQAKMSSDSELEMNSKQILENNDIIWRDWFFNKIDKIIDITSSISNNGQQQPTIKNITVIFGQAGSGKTFLLQLLNETKRFQNRCLMSFYCKFTSSTPNDFINEFEKRINEIFHSNHNDSNKKQQQSSLSTAFIDHNVNFRENVLKFLNNLEKDPIIVNKHQLNNKRFLLLIDSIDLRPDICDLLANNLYSLPSWLHILITARPKRYRGITKLFSGARKIVIDDIKKTNVYNDIMGYLCKHQQTKLFLNNGSQCQQQSSSLSSTTSSTKHILNKIVHKSNGSILYVKILLNCIERKIFDVQKLDFIGATLNGLYLAIFSAMFNDNLEYESEFKTIFQSIDRINSFKISISDLIQKLNIDEDVIIKILNIIHHHQLIMYTNNNQTIKLIHSSLFEWLSDIKHCTARFICRSYFNDNNNNSNENGHNQLMNDLNEQLIKNRQLAMAINQKYIQNNDDSINDISDDMLYEKDRSDSQLGTVSGQAQLSSNSFSNNNKQQLDVLQQTNYIETNYSHIDRNFSFNNSKTNDNFVDNKKYNHSKFLSNKFDSTLIANDQNQSQHNNNNIVESITSNSLKGLNNKNNNNKSFLLPNDDDYCIGDSDNENNNNNNNNNDDDEDQIDQNDDLSKTEISKEYLNKLYQKFEQALHICDLKTLRNILQRYSNVIINQNFINGKTPMYWAIKKSNIKLVELFLEFNVDVNAVCDPQWGYSSLVLALMQHSFNICELLLENDADVELLDRYSMPPILHAILGNCSPEIIKLLLYWGSHTDFIDETGRSLLHFAANDPKIWSQTITLLLTVGCDEMHKDNNGQTALHMAAANGSAETVEVLIEFGGDKLIHTQDKSGKLALHEAVAKNASELCELLITPKSINAVAHSGHTPLRIAILNYYLDLAQLLILKGADVNYKDADGRSIIYCVVAFTHSTLEQKGPPYFNLATLYRNGPEEYIETAVKTIEFLTRFGVDLEIKDLEGRTALHVAAWQGTYALVECLIKLGANIDALDAEGRTPLHMCAWNGHIDVVRLLIDSGCMVNPISSTQGASPLLVAAQQGHYDTCTYLLQSGSDISHRDFYSRNAKDVALNCGHKDIVQLIDSFITSTTASKLDTKFIESNQQPHNELLNNNNNNIDNQELMTGIKYSKYDARFYTSNNISIAQNLDNNNGHLNNHNLSSTINNPNDNSSSNMKIGSRKNKKTRSISKLTRMLH